MFENFRPALTYQNHSTTLAEGDKERIVPTLYFLIWALQLESGQLLLLEHR